MPGPSGIGLDSTDSVGSSLDPIIIDSPPQSLEGVLKAHASKYIDECSEYTLTVDRTTREHLWTTVLSFYKGAKVKPNKLHKLLVIQFVGEAGADAGALRKEFFEDALKEARVRLFEGEDDCMVPRKDLGLQVEFEISGMLLAHSILQEGPTMAALSSCVYQFLVSGNAELYMCSKNDIPLNMATHHLVTFIEQVGLNCEAGVYRGGWTRSCAQSIKL